MFDTHPPVQKRIAVLLEMAHVGPEALAEAPPAAQAAGVPPRPRRPPAAARPTARGPCRCASARDRRLIRRRREERSAGPR